MIADLNPICLFISLLCLTTLFVISVLNLIIVFFSWKERTWCTIDFFEQIENVLFKVSEIESLFISWFVANWEVKLLTYGQFVSKFVYEKKKKVGNQGKEVTKLVV